MISISDLFRPLTSDEAMEGFLAALETLKIPARSWKKGGAYRTILRAIANAHEGFSQVMVAFFKSGFLEDAEGLWLRILAKRLYGVDFIAATFATGKATFTNNGGGVFNEPAGTVTIKNPTTTKYYVTTEALVLNPGDPPVTIGIIAVEIGAASSSAPGEITELSTQLLEVAVSNAASVIGTDDEDDELLRQRCRDKLGTLSVRGPRGAYAYAARSALRLDGSPVNINRVAVSPFSSTGIVDVYVAAPSGAPDPADLTAIAANIEELARPDTVTANVHAATEVPSSLPTLTIYAKRTAGVSAADIKALVDTAIETAIANYPIGGIPTPPTPQGYLYADFVAGTCKSAHPSIYHVTGQGSDVALSPGEVPILTATTTVRIVDVSA